MRKGTAATAITADVKRVVAARGEFGGWPCCIVCGQPAPQNAPTVFSCAHYIPRSQGGLGVEQNIVTLCPRCHGMYDQGIDRKAMRNYIKEYLQSKYPDWDEEKLYYRR